MAGLFATLTKPNGHSYSQPLGLFIGKEFIKGSSENPITSIDPFTEFEIATVQAALAEDVATVTAAHAALKSGPWKTLPGTERGILMNRLADLMEQIKELLARKPYKDALEGDLPEAIGTMRYYAGWADKVFGQTISTTSGKFAYTTRQPIGVVGQIIPWNYPLSMACWKLGPALACGNTVVLKEAEQTPLSILVLGRLVREADSPPGVVNLSNRL